MMSVQHSDILAAGVDRWNQWRQNNPTMLPDLRGANLRGSVLTGAQLSDAVLIGADLSDTDLCGAYLSRADLRGALLTRADLRDADLRGAVLTDVIAGPGNAMVDITDADFTGANFGWTVIGDVYLNRMIGVGRIRHSGPSYISTSTLEFTTTELFPHGMTRTDVEAFLLGAGVLLDAFKRFGESSLSHPFHSAFISYSHSDKEFAKRMHTTLESNGIRCWLDEKNMKPGERILDAVDTAISSHDRLILCCSETSLQSWWVHDEIRKVIEIERRASTDLKIIPLLLDNYLIEKWTDGLASDLRSRLAVDFRGWRNPRQWATAIEKLLLALTR
ncbi:toll/interleukin-1 receptor domain-containing protein [Nocardia abscessus]|uniref:toll/interleukin-1 receptor domain-containing protein n=1 Tax=Nocardia abscessus TaxID=120957 RepID=UPI0018956667|nr:toll/interleukin-1 receptor domain-containing protein [Nocardia abscessus]MBF6341257.1 toll/interleukin-1 receptor domain-containing protein [Nocardia abscessus]